MHFETSLRARLGLTCACATWLALTYCLPIEEHVLHPLGPALFAVKALLTFAALLPMLHGLGHLLLVPLRRLAAGFGGQSAPDDCPEERRWLRLGLPALLGTALCGLITFVVGLVTPPTPWLVVVLSAAGFALFCRYPPQLPRWVDVWPKATWERLLLLLVAAGYAFRLGDTLFFQSQEDGYLYHLSLAELWLRHGQTGVQLANIYSGYALNIEHYYLWLKLLGRGTAEQNALAQLTHLGIGYGMCLAALRGLGGRWLGGVKTTVLLAFCLHGPLVAAIILPKNDGFLAASALTALYGLLATQPLYFMAGAAIAMAIKPTAGLIFAVIGVTAITQSALNKSGKDLPRRAWVARLAHMLQLLSVGVVLMLAGWLPYAWRNGAVTGDPFFPLLGELFPTPFAPGLQSVIAEARPLSLPLAALLRSLVMWLVSEPMVLLALAAGLAAQLSRASSQGTLRFLRWPRLMPLLVFSVGGFCLLEEAMGPYATMVSPRHFLTMLGVLATISTGLLFAGCVQRRQIIVAACLGVALGLSFSNLDVSARDIFRHLSQGNLSQRIMAQKPLLAVHAELNRRLAHGAPARVYAITESNASSFLTVADFWHATMTYPAWTWSADVSGEELGSLLRKNHIDYLITETKKELKYGPPPGAIPLFTVQNMTLWQIPPAPQ